MSKKPNIYAYCKAGCPWETVHKDDFEKSAAYIKKYPTDEGQFILEEGRVYEINTISNTSATLGLWGFIIHISAAWECMGAPYSDSVIVALPEFDKFRQDVTFCFRGVEVFTDSLGTKYINLHYDLNGEKKSQTILPNMDVENESVSIIAEPYSYAQIEVLHVNEDAEIRAKSAYEIACDNGFEGTEQEWLDSLKGSGTDKDALKIDNEATSATEKGLLIGQKGSTQVEVIKLGNGLKLENGKLSLSLDNAEGASF